MLYGRGTKHAYNQWLRNMKMELIEHHVQPEVAEAVVSKVERNTMPQDHKVRKFRTMNED